VQFGGRVQRSLDGAGELVHEWVDTRDVLATPYDTPIPGYGTKTVNTLRLWGAKAIREFDLDEFNEGDYIGAIEARARSQNICDYRVSLAEQIFPGSGLSERGRSAAASRARLSMAGQSPALTRSAGATHEPPTQATLGSAR